MTDFIGAGGDGMDEETQRWLTTEAIFHDALLAPETERTALLNVRCQGDTTLMAELRSLLAACEAEEVHRRGVSGQGVDAGTSVGPYVIERLIGRGGMGGVYLAQRGDGQFAQQVAIKIIDMPLVTDYFRERFRAERQMLAGLAHPYIARLLDGGVTADGELYLVMEFIDGVTITEFCDTQQLKVEARLELFLKVCEAVQYAHQHLIVHRDLKPENILVTGDATPRLLDFGTAKMLQPASNTPAENATRAGMNVFTPRYASPEQVLGQAITVASDTYSLGVLLYVLLTARAPYELQDFSTEELLRIICEVQPHRPSETACPFGAINRDLDSIVLKALRKEPEERYRTVDQFAADVQAYLAQRPVLARQGGLRYQAARFIRRNRLALGAAALLVLTLGAGVAGVMWQARVARAQSRKAEARTAELRELSSSLLTEIDTAVKDLPGSTAAQQALISNVLQHLDKLAADAGKDPLLSLDMLSAYTRMGNLEGNPYGQNIGDPSVGLVSLNKALSFAPNLHVAISQNRAVLRAYGFAQKSRSEILYALGRDAESEAALRDGLKAFDRLAARPDVTAEELSEVASAYNALGDQGSRRGDNDPNDPNGSVSAYRRDLALVDRALKLDPRQIRALRGRALITSKIAMVTNDTDPLGAVSESRLALAGWDALPADARVTRANQQGKSFSLREMGAALEKVGDFASALAAYDQALRIDEVYAKADAKDMSATFWVANDLAYRAEVHGMMFDSLHPLSTREKELHRREALVLYRRCVDLYASLLAHDPNNPTWLAEGLQAQVSLGTMQYGTPEAEKGLQMAHAALASLRTHADKPDVPLIMLVPAVTRSLSVRPIRLRDPAWTVKAAERLNVRTGRKTPAYLLLLSMAYLDSGDKEKAMQTAHEGLSHLKPLPPDVATPAEQRLLETAARGIRPEVFDNL